jgi:hypothetical protein
MGVRRWPYTLHENACSTGGCRAILHTAGAEETQSSTQQSIPQQHSCKPAIHTCQAQRLLLGIDECQNGRPHTPLAAVL